MAASPSSAGGPETVTLEVDGEKIAWLTFDLPDSKVNLLTTDVMRALDRRLGELESHISTGRLVSVVLRSGKPGAFMAGADVHQIAALRDRAEALEKSREGQRIFRRLERLTVPTIAAIDGLCLGGGTELALSCAYRIASDRDSTRIGLPEVRLGILPGFGGCVRLPRLCGIQNALRLILTGKPVPASRARRIGLVDRVARSDRFDAELRTFVADVLAGRQPRGGYSKSATERLLEDTAPGRKILFALARRQAERDARGRYPAPLRALEVVEETYGMPVDEALGREAAALADLSQTEVSKSLIRLFLLQREAKRALPPEELAGRTEVGKVAVLGAGVMGGSIAELTAAHDLPTVLKEIQQDALDAGLRHARELLQKGARRGIFSAEEAGLKFALIHGTLTYEKLEGTDLVIEAVVERMAVKQQVLRECEEHIPESAVFATNTSALSVSELASAAAHPARVLGLHFFNPVHRMPLVEVVRTDASASEAVATAFGFALDMGKTPVLVADGPGFLVNRLLGPYLNEAGFLVEEGASVQQVDGVLLRFGMPMGPGRLLDEVGYDVAEHVAQELHRGLGPRLSSSSIVGILREEGRLGRKNGRGFYRYEKGREKGVDREVGRLLARRFGTRTFEDEEIRQRCLYPMVNEAAHALADGVVAGAGDVDVAMVTGTGFPPFRGGLLRWADSEGLPRIVERLDELEARHGARFSPAPLLRELAEEGRRFTEPA
ncbi:MAG: 3-hydroxyacyl-CoA dehydrogenase NAD-binding domain-containing protein [Gemmatimonadota bacterium]